MILQKYNVLRFFFLFAYVFLPFLLWGHLQDSVLIIYHDSAKEYELSKGDYIVVRTLWGETLSGQLDIINERRIAVDGIIVPVSRIKILTRKGWLYKVGRGLVNASKWLFHKDLHWLSNGMNVEVEDLEELVVIFGLEFFFFVFIIGFVVLLLGLGEFFKLFGRRYNLRRKWRATVRLSS